jgi:hypothetical protein
MNPLYWTRTHRIAFFGATVLGACLGFIVGIRRVDPAASQDQYWLWLSVWVVSGALAGAAIGFMRQLLRHP